MGGVQADYYYYFISLGTCDKPTIYDGYLVPDNVTIVSGEGYTLTCDTGFEISGSATIACTDGVLTDALPSCVAKGMCIYVSVQVIDQVNFHLSF